MFSHCSFWSKSLHLCTKRLIKWFSNYASGRQSKTVLRDALSKIRVVRTGVSENSVSPNFFFWIFTFMTLHHPPMNCNSPTRSTSTVLSTSTVIQLALEKHPKPNFVFLNPSLNFAEYCKNICKSYAQDIDLEGLLPGFLGNVQKHFTDYFWSFGSPNFRLCEPDLIPPCQ